MKQLTVIVPCYNVEKSVAATLDSLLAQTYKDLCILVIDNGSFDDTGRIVAEYAARYDHIRVISMVNQGIATARNVGISNVDTPYFGFVDSDDTVLPDMYEKMMAAIDGHDLCVSDFRWVWPNKERYQIEGPYDGSSEMIRKMVATLWNKVYRTDLIKRYDLSFPDGYRYEDACFLYCLAANPLKVAFVHEPFVNYIQREGSITHTNNEKVHDMIVVFEKISEYYHMHNKCDEFSKELEFLYAKFFLGNSFLRACQIRDNKIRNRILDESYSTLIKNYPNFHSNPYLKDFGFAKRTYYRLINKTNYRLIGSLLHIVYSLKGGI